MLDTLECQQDSENDETGQAYGIIWTLNAQRARETQEYIQKIRSDSGGRKFKIFKVYDCSCELSQDLNPEAKKLFAYFQTLSRAISVQSRKGSSSRLSSCLQTTSNLCKFIGYNFGMYEPSLEFFGSPTDREFVTGKELLALWIAHKYGGVILDAGCQAAEPWNLRHLNPNTFYVPSIRGQEYVRINREQSFDGKSYVIPFFLQILLQGTPLQNHVSKFETTQTSIYIDNWLHIAPRGSLVALYALRTYLNWLPSAYAWLEQTKEDLTDLSLLPHGGGYFASCCATIALGSILQGYYEYFLQHPSDPNHPIRMNEKHFSIENVTLPCRQNHQPGMQILEAVPVAKRISAFPFDNHTRLIVGGWRAKLTHAKMLGALARYHYFKRIWDQLS